MIRVVIENFLLFLLPTLIYAAWMLYMRSKDEARDEDGNKPPVRVLVDDAPLLWLFVAGAALVIATLVTFGTYTGGKPGQHYTPGVLRDGKIEPGQIR
ncbi:hypothetical protein W911_14990 [Hyphomicrobium nitrativorans NL23]|uniref:Uncharacterized protein n=1 Tax=Hyphomicrobium nitrativorans NL23 TaxID=1029756 RepID=V5SEW0_9HYPH|nr:DUF6111 family protein [Hyphomicrobium nitrativorans]AHB49401.1 hypothetical protein W911_14990 [Hyphomicrobium nitrativorans NL23]